MSNQLHLRAQVELKIFVHLPTIRGILSTFNMMAENLVNFERCFWLKKKDHFMGNLGPNMIEHVSEMESYIILTLNKFEHWKWTVLITKYQCVHGGLNKHCRETGF